MCDLCSDRNPKVIKAIGDYLGYPKCCSTWQAEVAMPSMDKDIFPLTEQQVSLCRRLDDENNFHGFMPCPECTKKLEENNTDDVSTLIKDRKASTDYPVEPPYIEVVTYLKVNNIL